MVDENQPDTDESSAPENNSDDTTAGDDWGEDWESAFQAEEFLFSEDEQKDGGDGSGEGGGTGYDFSPGDTDSFGDLPDFDADDASTEKDDQVGEDTTDDAESGPGFFAKLKERAATLPTTTWLAITGTLTLLFLGTLLFQLLGSSQEPTIQYVQIPQEESSPQKTEEKLAETPPEVTPKKQEKPAEEPLVIPPQVEKIRTKWPFEPFLISTTDKESGETTFVSVKLTLITLVDEGTELPHDQKLFVRDTIFQFFANRPFYELRRYSLARGEMNRKLLEWLRREWSQGDVSAIMIQHYKVG